MVSDKCLYYCELEFSEVYQNQGYRYQFSKQYLPAAANHSIIVSR